MIFRILLFFALVPSLYAGQVSVIIPCYWKHFQFLEALLEAYAGQTRVPDEVVVSLSEAYQVPEGEIQRLEAREYPFEFKLIKTDKILYAGENRNVAAAHARHEILLTQDADDLPHPQRVEILAHWMERPGINHIIHQWLPEEGGPKANGPVPQWVDFYENPRAIRRRFVKTTKDFAAYEYLHNGHIALRKSLWNKFKWPRNKRGQDRIYNMTLIHAERNTLILFAPLVIYRHQFSSIKKSSGTFVMSNSCQSRS